MNTLNTTKMTSTKIKDISLALVLIGSLLGAMLSSSVNAATVPSIENAVSNFVVDQGEKMITELNTQLQQSIDSKIKTFTINLSLDDAAAWLSEEQQEKATVSSKKSTQKDPETEI